MDYIRITEGGHRGFKTRGVRFLSAKGTPLWGLAAPKYCFPTKILNLLIPVLHYECIDTCIMRLGSF